MVKRHQSLREAEFGFGDIAHAATDKRTWEWWERRTDEFKYQLRCESGKTLVTSTQTGRH